jgi:hypothetical protein
MNAPVRTFEIKPAVRDAVPLLIGLKAAKLRGGGPILKAGIAAMGESGTPRVGRGEETGFQVEQRNWYERPDDGRRHA